MQNPELRDEILKLAAKRGPGASLCPSEPARSFFGPAWRDHMPDVRAVAAKLSDEGLIEVTQKGQPADIRTAKGPVRLRLREKQA